MIPTWIELHVDDVLLERDPSRWDEVAALLERIAALGPVSFRLRETFASLDRHGFVASLVRRGHEVGWHAHGRRLRQARDAVVRAGGNAAIAAPGLVQGARRRVLREAAALGVTRITDRVEERHFAYQGWLAWEPLPGMTSLDVSVSPFAWGVLERAGGRARPGRPDWTELGRRLEVASRWQVPEGASAFFGATVHEHDLTAPGTLRPDGLDGLARFLERHRVVRSGDVPPSERFRGGPARRSWSLPSLRRANLAIGGVRARRVGPATPRAALVVMHGGPSGIAQGLGFCGLPDDAFPDLAVWTWERSGEPRTPGNPAHVAQARAVLDAARAEGVPTGILTWSGGIVPGLAVADAGARFVVDCEGPADRFSLVGPQGEGGELAALDPHDDAAWAGREAVELVRSFHGRYHRVQGAVDHVHGGMPWHARRMVAAAPDGRLTLLPGRLADHGEAVRRVVEGEVLRVGEHVREGAGARGAT